MEIEASGSRVDPVPQQRKLYRNELFLLLRDERFFSFSSSKCNERLLQYVMNQLGIVDPSETLIKQLKDVIKVFVAKLLAKWRECKYMFDRFNVKHANWLSEEFKLPEIHSKTSQQPTSSEKKRGRPKKLFEASSERSRKRKLKSLVSRFTPEKLCLATETSLVKSGKRKAAHVVKLAINSTPKRLKKMEQVHSSSCSVNIMQYSAEEALGLIVDLNLTKNEYGTMCLGAKKRGADLYPSYHVVADAKLKCYPLNLRVTENEAVVPLQDLLDHTIRRLAHVQSEVILSNIDDNNDTLEVYYKWGLDGSGGHSIYKQNFSNDSIYADSNIILCTIVPLELSEMKDRKKIIYWKNQTPSSTRHCRPISFKLKKENDQNTKDEYHEIEQQIRQLQHTGIILGDRTIHFKHIPICTMLDGKTVNVLTETKSTQACNVCKATPTHMNDLNNIKKRVCNEDIYKFGISILHAHLRCYEYLLHISYKLELQQWQARGKEAQEKVKERKNKICKDFYKEMGLVVDQPKQGGGNSNDGNTARKFFKNPVMVSQITGVSKELIERFANILCVISCGHYIDEEKFRTYCIGTAEMAINLYKWYKMSASVHKLLIHGADIIKSLALPVGQLSEDVIEASHKNYKKLRQYHSRKTSRINTNMDILHWMLVSSDPVVTSLREKPKKRGEIYNDVIVGMLRMPTYLCSEEDENRDSDDSDNYVDDDEQ